MKRAPLAETLCLLSVLTAAPGPRAEAAETTTAVVAADQDQPRPDRNKPSDGIPLPSSAAWRESGRPPTVPRRPPRNASGGVRRDRSFVAQRFETKPRLRRPVALEVSANQRWLHVANRRSGTLSTVDLRRHEVVAETSVGRQPSDMTRLDERTLLLTDEAAHHLLMLRTDGPAVSVRRRIEVARYPVSVAVLADGRAVVSSLWSRQLTRVDLRQDPPAVEMLDMPWAPRELLPLPDGMLLVADAFGGRLGIVEPGRWKLLHTREFPAHNIRGLALSRDKSKVLVAHQMLNELAHTVRNDVHWGLLMSNDLRYLPLKSLMDPQRDLYQGTLMHPLGEAGSATADPSGLAVAADGTAVVALGGVGEISIGGRDRFSLSRMEVGRRPTDVALLADDRTAAVANTFDDSVTLVDFRERETLRTVSLGPQAELSLADEGELLFFDGSLSHDSWMSCHSCHTDGHTNGQRNDNLSDFKTFGAPKRVLSLLGKRDTAPFAWSGGAADYAAQINNSISSTMQSDREPRPGDVRALTAYLESLAPPPPLDVARQRVDPRAAARGRRVFADRRCTTCHAAPAYTTADSYDVGLADELGRRRFNPPSLRGVSQRGPYFHDGRAKSLQDVLQKHQHQLDEALGAEDLADLLAFLRSL